MIQPIVLLSSLGKSSRGRYLAAIEMNNVQALNHGAGNRARRRSGLSVVDPSARGGGMGNYEFYRWLRDERKKPATGRNLFFPASRRDGCNSGSCVV